MSLLLLLFSAATDAMSVGAGGRFQLERSSDGFGIRSHGIVEKVGPNRTKHYPLPQSTADEYVRLRPEDLKRNPFTAEEYLRQEVIGPFQVENDKLWFGKQYYDSEGQRGVGAFGYFDSSTRAYTLFSPPEVARYQVSAILVQPDCVWLGLDRFVEDISTKPGGLVRWDRSAHEVQRYPLEFVIESIRAEDDSLRLVTRAPVIRSCNAAWSGDSSPMGNRSPSFHRLQHTIDPEVA